MTSKKCESVSFMDGLLGQSRVINQMTSLYRIHPFSYNTHTHIQNHTHTHKHTHHIYIPSIPGKVFKFLELVDI